MGLFVLEPALFKLSNESVFSGSPRIPRTPGRVRILRGPWECWGSGGASTALGGLYLVWLIFGTKTDIRDSHLDMRLRPGLELCTFCCVCLRRTLQYSYVLLAWRHASAYLWLCTRLSARLLCPFVEDHTNLVHRNIHLEKFVSLAIHLIWGYVFGL